MKFTFFSLSKIRKNQHKDDYLLPSYFFSRSSKNHVKLFVFGQPHLPMRIPMPPLSANFGKTVSTAPGLCDLKHVNPCFGHLLP